MRQTSYGSIRCVCPSLLLSVQDYRISRFAHGKEGITTVLPTGRMFICGLGVKPEASDAMQEHTTQMSAPK